MSRSKLLLVAVLVALVAAFFAFDLGRYLSLEYIKQSQAGFAELYAGRPALVVGVFLRRLRRRHRAVVARRGDADARGGAIFGLVVGTVVVSFASSIGATLAFLVSRYVLRDSVQARFGDRLAEIDEGVAKDGAFYLFTLRLVPLFPFFLINLLMGLTRMKRLAPSTGSASSACSPAPSST